MIEEVEHEGRAHHPTRVSECKGFCCGSTQGQPTTSTAFSLSGHLCHWVHQPPLANSCKPLCVHLPPLASIDLFHTLSGYAHCARLSAVEPLFLGIRISSLAVSPSLSLASSPYFSAIMFIIVQSPKPQERAGTSGARDYPSLHPHEVPLVHSTA